MSTTALMMAMALSSCPAQDEVLTAAADRIEAVYWSATDGATIASEVRRWRDAGRYNAECDRPQDFARRFQRDLGVFDGHFMVEMVNTGAESDNWLTAWRASAIPANAGIRDVSVLEGNVGYLRISSFYGWDLARQKLESALTLLSDVSGLIIDLRQNGGGGEDTPGHLLRALLPETVQSVVSVERRSGRTEEKLPALALPPVSPEVPVIVLVDRRTGSAAEAVAYALQSQKRARLVGVRSGGAAHMLDAPQPLAHGLAIGIPNARPIDPITGGNWEQTGVTPDVRGGDDPLFVARQLIAEELAGRTGGS